MSLSWFLFLPVEFAPLMYKGLCVGPLSLRASSLSASHFLLSGSPGFLFETWIMFLNIPLSKDLVEEMVEVLKIDLLSKSSCVGPEVPDVMGCNAFVVMLRIAAGS